MVADSPYSRAMRELSIRRRYGRPSRDYPGDPAADLDRICADDRLKHAYADAVELAVAAAAIVLCFAVVAWLR